MIRIGTKLLAAALGFAATLLAAKAALAQNCAGCGSELGADCQLANGAMNVVRYGEKDKWVQI